ncbi:hypothetical protein [Kaarinaea lacus]
MKNKCLLVYVVVVLTTAFNNDAYAVGQVTSNQFNPAISLVLDGRYSDFDNNELSLPGFQLGGEAGYPDQGFSLGHNELIISANVDDKFYGNFGAAMTQVDGETVFELEEVFIETLGLGAGFNIKAGQFYSGIGYLNAIHDHAHDFTDVPLVYTGLFGNHLMDTGVQARWLAPLDLYTELGVEVLRGDGFPGGSNENNNNGRSVFAKVGGDIGVSSSWQAGLSYYQSEFDVREAGGHTHGGAAAVDNELVNGKTQVAGIDVVYKWAPQGNSTQRNLKLQFEYFIRDENGHAEFAEDGNNAAADYDGEQQGYYLQAVYQFIPQWRVGLRFDQLLAENTITNFSGTGIDQEEFEQESGLGSGYDPQRASIMVDYAPSEFSRLRLQYNRDETQPKADDQLYIQFLMSLGAHGAHKY